MHETRKPAETGSPARVATVRPTLRLAAGDPAPGAREDRALLAAHLDGDGGAFAELVRRYQAPVFRLALRYARDADEAEELAQRTFLRVFERGAALLASDSFRPYLFRIAANLCRNHLRDRARLVFGVPLTLAAPEGEPLELTQRRARVREALARLPLRQRQVVSLRVDAALPFADVARALGITENNAKVTYHHAIRRLRTQLAGEDL